MQKKIALLFLSMLVMLACTLGVPAASGPVPTKAFGDPFIPTDSSAPTASTGAPFTVVRLSSQDGGLIEQITAEAPRAAALGQHMFVEFDASW